MPFTLNKYNFSTVCESNKIGTTLHPESVYRADRDAFASTLTSLDERFSRKWERRAAPPLTSVKIAA
jgi:hypothetical protein